MSSTLNNKQMECFIAVAEELNFRIAAERLYMTQPPLSRQIKKLEETLDIKLFDRGRQGVHLTEAGQQFLQDARALLKQADDTLKKVRNQKHKKECNELNVGITTVVDIGMFPDMKLLFQSCHPSIKLNIKPQISINLIKNLNRGFLDIALIGLPSLTEDLTVEKLISDPLAVALPSNHPLSRKKQLTISELQNETLFWFNRELNPAYYEHCQRMFKTLKFSPQVIPEPVDHHVLLGLIANGHGIGLIPSSLKAIQRKGILYKSLAEGGLMSIGIGMAYKADSNSSQLQKFIQITRKYYANQNNFKLAADEPVICTSHKLI